MDISLKTTNNYALNMNLRMNDKMTSTFSIEGSKLKNACLEMESIFIEKMLHQMRASIPKNGFVSGGKAEEMFTSMLDAELAKTMSASGGIRLSTMFQGQLENIKEMKQEK